MGETRKTGTLKIYLKSDLCIGSGLSYAGVIDQDVVYDEEGFPYIPGRRLKGCLREAAALFTDQKQLDTFFGKAGQNAPGQIYIENAVLSGLKALRQEIQQARKENVIKPHLDTEDILGLYTSVRAQTAIDMNTGTAKKDTLRITRVVNRTNPLAVGEQKPLCFEARVYYYEKDSDGNSCVEGKNSEVEQFLKDAANALRHMGIDRNRGLGNVKCSFKGKGAENREADNRKAEKQEEDKAISGDSVHFTYTLKNREPLMLSDLDKDNTISYISGRSVIGALAATYIRLLKNDGEEHPADTEEFEDLFLNGKVRYYNANLAINGMRSVPVPLYVNCLKKTKKPVNVLDPEYIKVLDQAYIKEKDTKKPGAKEVFIKKISGKDCGNENHTDRKGSDYDWEGGNQPKKLKNQYMLFPNEKDKKMFYTAAEPERDLSFHHRHKHGEGTPEAILYSQEILVSGQTFIGMIDAPIKYQNRLEELLKNTDFYFGKSRNAQYGACDLVSFEQDTSNWPGSCFGEKEEIIVTFLSDGIFVNDKGAYTVQFDEVKAILAQELGIPMEKSKDEKSMIQTTIVTGYNTKWNRKRDAIPAIKAGSAFVYTVKEGEKWISGTSFAGERNQEGYGEIAVCSQSQMKFPMVVNPAEKPEIKDNKPYQLTKPLSRELQNALCRILQPKVVRQLLEKELSNEKTETKMSASAIGRVILMLEECSAIYTNENDLVIELMRRIHSIKTESTREEALNMIPYVVKKKIEQTESQGETEKGEDNSDKWKYEVDTETMIKDIREDCTLKKKILMGKIYIQLKKIKILKKKIPSGNLIFFTQVQKVTLSRKIPIMVRIRKRI